MKKLETMKTEDFFSDGLKSGITKLNVEIEKFNADLETLQARTEKIEDVWSFENVSDFLKELEVIRKGTLTMAFKTRQLLTRKIQFVRVAMADKDSALLANRNTAENRVKHIQAEVLKIFPGRITRANSVISEDEELINLRQKYTIIETYGNWDANFINQLEIMIDDAKDLILNEIKLQTGKDFENE